MATVLKKLVPVTGASVTFSNTSKSMGIASYSLSPSTANVVLDGYLPHLVSSGNTEGRSNIDNDTAATFLLVLAPGDEEEQRITVAPYARDVSFEGGVRLDYELYLQNVSISGYGLMVAQSDIYI